MAKKSFEALGIKRMFINNMNNVEIRKPTPVQENCIPAILEGRSVVACAATGSGKTTAYALPVLQLLSEDPRGIFALILVPTRELAYQIGEAVNALHNKSCFVVTGGRSRLYQSVELEKRPHIVVATPGRLADHVERGTDLDLSSVQILVFDEADRLLEDGFGEDIQTIVEKLPTNRQTLLFSATYTQALKDAAKSFPEDSPAFVWREGVVDAESDKIGATVAQLKDYKLKMPLHYKDSYLVQIVKQYTAANPRSLVIIFTNHCKWCHLIYMILHQFGVKSVILHSVLSQRRRLKSLHQFRSNQVRVLVATEVASRGLDIPMVDFIINENVPARAKDYLHRVGRTARAGRPGLAVTLVNQFELERLKSVESYIERELPMYEDVKMEDVAAIVKKVTLARRMAEAKLDGLKFDLIVKTNKEKKEILDALTRTSHPQDAEETGGESSKRPAPSEDDEKPAKKKKKRKMSS